ncbi:MAG: nuclear transport factor 2 family protein [Pseudomonadota bacterium]
MATKSVTKYLGVERALLQALNTRDEKAAAAMLADDFEQKTPIREQAAAGDDWLAEELKKPHAGERVRDLTVLEEGDIAIVSFMLESPPPKDGKGKAAPSYFVVDIWKQSSGKLVARYMDMPSNAPPFHAGPNTRE